MMIKYRDNANLMQREIRIKGKINANLMQGYCKHETYNATASLAPGQDRLEANHVLS
jgi:hypothetical protein